MNLLLAFGFGCVVGSLFTQYWPWVRGVAGNAWGAVMGRPPARAATITPLEMEAPAPRLRPNSPDLGLNTPDDTEVRPKQASLGLTQAAGNVLKWLSGALGFLVRYWKPIALVLLALLILGLMRGCSLPFEFKSKGELRLERELAEANTRIAQHEARLGQLAGELAVNTERDRTRRATVITQAEREIEDATAQVDPHAQHRAYERGYLCLLDPRACEGGANPPPGGPAPVRGLGPDAA